MFLSAIRVRLQVPIDSPELFPRQSSPGHIGRARSVATRHRNSAAERSAAPWLAHCAPRQAEKLHQMVGDHVAKCSGSVEVTATALYAYRLGVRNLHMVNVTPVPDWL